MPDVVTNPITRERVTFQETALTTGGQRSIIDVEMQPGGGVPLHRHDTYDEHVEVLQGTVDFIVEGERHRLSAGDSLTIRRGQIHRFENATDAPCEWRVRVEPSVAGYELMLRAVHGLAADGKANASGLPRDPRVIALLSEWSDTRLVGLWRVLAPLMSLLRALGRRAGVDREIRERYAERPAEPAHARAV